MASWLAWVSWESGESWESLGHSRGTEAAALLLEARGVDRRRRGGAAKGAVEVAVLSCVGPKKGINRNNKIWSPIFNIIFAGSET